MWAWKLAMAASGCTGEIGMARLYTGPDESGPGRGCDRGRCVGSDPASADHAEQHRDDRDDKQDVDQAAKRHRSEHADEPEDDEDDGDGVEHGFSDLFLDTGVVDDVLDAFDVVCDGCRACLFIGAVDK